MDKKYTRLKLKMLLLMAAGTAAGLSLGYLVLEYLVDGLFQAPFAQAFVWLATHLFGYDDSAALDLYAQYIRGNKTAFLNGAILVLMLVAFYLAMGLFTRWLRQISAGVRQLIDGSRQPVSLPRELSPLQDDLNTLCATLSAREEETRQSEQRKNDLLVFLAHDLKTPLTSVIGYLTLLRDDPDLTAEQRAKYTGIALDKALRLEDLILEFFDITRQSLHQAPAQPVTIQLSMLLEQLADEFMPQFQEKSLRCVTQIEPRLTVSGDPDKLARVFDNILRNAVNYSVAGGEVIIRAALEGERVVISVSNEGLEIPEQELARIFEKFYRLDAARSSRTGGAGLGLAIAKEIVEAHGGTIHARSADEQVTFTVILPVEGSV